MINTHNIKQGKNVFEIRLIVGGMGLLWQKLEIRYNKCSRFHESVNQSSCNAIEDDPQNICTKQNSQCLDSSTRRIGSTDIQRCWNEKINYNCKSAEYIDHCQKFKDDPNCEEVDIECLLSDGEECLTYKNHYECTEKLSTVETNDKISYFYGKSTKDSIDSSSCDVFSGNKYCNLEAEQCVDKQNRIINDLEIARDCWKYEKRYKCKNDEFTGNECQELEDNCQFTTKTCLSKTEEEDCTHYEKFFQCVVRSDNSFESLTCGSENHGYQKNTDLLKVASNLNALLAAGEDNDGVSIFIGEGMGCDRATLSSNNCCKNSGWGNDLGMASCSSDEQLLSEKKKRGQCHYVGSYCSEKEKLFKTCLKTRLNYCCFGGKIARIIQEQGRAQLGKSWGGVEAPDCLGLALEDIDSLDFSLMDFSEIASDINIKNIDGNSLNSKVKESIKKLMNRGGQNE